MSAPKRKLAAEKAQAGGEGPPITVLGTLHKAIKAGSSWPDKDEFLDVVYWIRQILGILVGVIWGVFAIKGLVGIILFVAVNMALVYVVYLLRWRRFVAVNMALVYVYFSAFQRVDEEEYGGISEILKEGLMTSFATFFVTWIILYSALHVD